MLLSYLLIPLMWVPIARVINTCVIDSNVDGYAYLATCILKGHRNPMDLMIPLSGFQLSKRDILKEVLEQT